MNAEEQPAMGYNISSRVSGNTLRLFMVQKTTIEYIKPGLKAEFPRYLLCLSGRWGAPLLTEPSWSVWENLDLGRG